MTPTDYGSLSPSQKELLDEAAKAMETAYNPYSGFFVGAAMRTSDGQIFTGSNVENAAHGSICAERSAIVRANAEGYRHFTAVAVIARGKDFDSTIATAPCGACRQMLYEFAQLSGVNLEVILSTTQKDKIILTDIEELLPLGFGPSDLGIDLKLFR